MYSSARDMANLMIDLLKGAGNYNNSKILPSILVRDLFLPIFNNPDFRTSFGAPWEIRNEAGYGIRRKGGNVPGYKINYYITP